MATIDWPAGLIPQSARLALRKSGQLSASPFNGSTQAWDFASERWVLSVTLPELASRQPRGVDSFLNFMAGGINRVRGWHFGKRGMIAGTLRGSPVLGVAGVKGDTSLTLANATSTNLLAGGGFELDTDANNIADGWAQHSAGTFTLLGNAIVAGTSSAYAQQVGWTDLGAADTDQIGFISAANGGIVAGQSYTLSYDAGGIAVAGPSTRGGVAWYTAADALISSSVTAPAVLGAGMSRYSVTATAPALAVAFRVLVWVESNPLGAGSNSANFDNVCLSAGTSTDFGSPATLKADDLLGLAGGQLVQVAADCTAADDLSMVVPITSHLRGAVSLNSAVTWNRPTAEFVMPALEAGAVWQPGRIERAALDLVEVW